jgi:DNA-binding NtrC family response regulator
MQKTILVADDETPLREALADVLRENGYKVATAPDGPQALQRLAESAIDVALVDIRMPHMNGMEVLARAQEMSPNTQVVIITAFGTVESAVEAIKLGASDYITKPFVFDDILAKIQRLLQMQRLVDENRFLLTELEDRYGFPGIVGRSQAIRDVLAVVQKLAQTRTSALITGKSGTGKELIARAIHYGGITKEGRFVAVNCAALPETLVESELFGHKRGAFSGAHRDKPGQFQVADGGTIFLDEISAMPLAVQPKLLRAIEEKRILPVGGTEPIDVDARILCATNSDMKREVEERRFRDDLYYRLNVVEIHIPPLAERRDDIPLLINHFVQKYNRQLNKNCPGVTDRAMCVMTAYAWPGNIRELANVIERGIIFSDGQPIDLPELSIAGARPPVPAAGQNDLKSAVCAFEGECIRQALQSNNYDKVAAAQQLNIGLSSLYRKMDELGISTRPEREQAASAPEQQSTP